MTDFTRNEVPEEVKKSFADKMENIVGTLAQLDHALWLLSGPDREEIAVADCKIPYVNNDGEVIVSQYNRGAIYRAAQEIVNLGTKMLNRMEMEVS